MNAERTVLPLEISLKTDIFFYCLLVFVLHPEYCGKANFIFVYYVCGGWSRLFREVTAAGTM